MPADLRDAHRLDRASYAFKPTARPMADRVRLVGLRKDGSTIPVTVTLSTVPTASRHFVLAVVRDATHERAQDDLADLLSAVAAEQAQHAEDLLGRVVASLFHVGLSLNTAAGQTAELARERISGALQRLDDTTPRDPRSCLPVPEAGQRRRGGLVTRCPDAQEAALMGSAASSR